ncbi:hypothetical protein LCGC14_1538750 [marine sediment metagenome]|uniref:Uncharacterized protein n=1 Tax=marine sediment metagenome TaxID=412755 RepID=A0A0F9L9S7_9ZZZZ
MPKAFEDCVEGGGRVRTISGPDKRFDLGKDQFIRICFDSKGSHEGEKKTNQTKKALRR